MKDYLVLVSSLIKQMIIYRGNVNHSNVMVLGSWGIQVLLKTVFLFQGLELRVLN